jgi:hypothetical protein
MTNLLLYIQDVASINNWRFMKLKEHMQGDIDAENEAYERYTQNVGLLEEIFCPTEDAAAEPEAEAETNSEEESMDILVSEAMARLKSDNESACSFKERVATLLDQKLKKLLENQTASEDQSPSDQNADDDTKPVELTTKQKMERSAKTNELLGKLAGARNEDDLKACRDVAAQLLDNENDSTVDKSNQVELLPRTQESSVAAAWPCSFPKLWTRMEVDDSFASKVSEGFASLDQFAQL